MVEVANKRTCKKAGDGVVYIGRPSVLGNRYVIGKHGTREEVIEKYRQWLRKVWVEGGEVKQDLLRLVGLVKRGDLTLVCWCKPLACHGDVLKQTIEALIANGY
jgi:hypothetical protein